MSSRLEIKNQALAEIFSDPITAEDEVSLGARETERFYDTCIKEMLESHDWGFATKRVLLAAVTNDRSNEWSYAYAVPADMGTPRTIVPDLSSLGYSLPVEGPYTPPYYEIWANISVVDQPYFIVEAGVIYSNTQTATLEYGARTVGEAVMPAMFQRALALELASRIAMPIKKDRILKGDLIKQAEAAKDRAMADDDNRSPRQFPATYVSEAALARRAV
jgi:hypothetical protein